MLWMDGTSSRKQWFAREESKRCTQSKQYKNLLREFQRAILHGLFAEKKQSSILTGNTPVPNPDPRQSKEDARQENADEEQEQQDSEEFGPIQNFGTASLSE